MPASFLRLESPREQVALPYVSLIKLELKRDEAALELSFFTHRALITGRKLAEIYQAVTDTEAHLVRVVSNEFAGDPAVPNYRELVHGIRIDPLNADEPQAVNPPARSGGVGGRPAPNRSRGRRAHQSWSSTKSPR
jgi:hypothetical protein